MLRDVSNNSSDLAAAANRLKQARDALQGFESIALAAVAESLSRTADTLVGVTERLEKSQPAEWMTPDQAARYLGCTSVAAFERVVAKEGVPKKYLSDRLPRYNRRELDEWMSSR